MEPRTQKLWAKQDRHKGDRLRLFSAVAEGIEVESVLYPGSFVDVAPSFVFPSATYVDSDRRAKQFFDDVGGVEEIIAANVTDKRPRSFTFLAGDYTNDLGIPLQSFDLLVSLYAGFISEHCFQYLRIGGLLLVNSSHGDAAMASIDSRFQLVAVVDAADGRYEVDSDALETHLVPKKPQPITVESLHQSGRGIAYVKSSFAYIFRRLR